MIGFAITMLIVFVVLGLVGYLTGDHVTQTCHHEYNGPFGTSATWTGKPICRKCGHVYGTTHREWL